MRVSAWASDVTFLGSPKVALISRNRVRRRRLASSEINATTISRPSSLRPIETTRTRGEAASSARRYLAQSDEYVKTLGVPIT
ncbi:MAG: hypothetical protein CNCCGFBP_02402 [Fimbriimonadaceae bacterium]|nr:hypothetical protein [Fimbriimonadaceae bacterium]